MTVQTSEPAPAELVDAGARLAGAGLSPGSSGNLSIRSGDRVVITATGADMGALDAASLSVLDLDGNLLSGPRPSKEYPLHRAFYRRSPETRAIVHLHSPKATAYACTDPWSDVTALPPITPYFVMRVGRTPLVPYADPGDVGQADLIEAMPGRFRAALLQNHGLVAAGPDMIAAVDTAVELEEACGIMLAAGSRRLRPLDDETARRLAEAYSSPWPRT